MNHCLFKVLHPSGLAVTCGGGVGTTCEAFNSTESAWISAGTMTSFHASDVALLLPNTGSILVAGSQQTWVQIMFELPPERLLLDL